MLDAAPARLKHLTREPVVFLVALAAINWFAFAVWSALLNNFAKEVAGFSGLDIGALQSIREIPGLLAVTALAWLLLMREQTLAYASLVALGAGIAMSGFFPSVGGLWATTFLMSVGFHYYETMAQSLALQLVPKARAPVVLGRLQSVASGAQLIAFGLVAGLWWWLAPKPGDQGPYAALFLGAGLLAILATIAAILLFPRFEGPVPQRKGVVLRPRYWLYYALTFMSGARRQIFMAFGAFLLVERFGFQVRDIALLMLVTYAVNMVFAPKLGALIARFGERRTIMFENVSLILVFLTYGLTSQGWLAAAAFVLDGVFFTFTIAQRTYFQKIADPADIAPTAGVAFTINHIAAVFIPVLFGLIWLKDPAIVFMVGAAIATVSLALAFLVPRDPRDGAETVFARPPAPKGLPAE